MRRTDLFERTMYRLGAAHHHQRERLSSGPQAALRLNRQNSANGFDGAWANHRSPCLSIRPASPSRRLISRCSCGGAWSKIAASIIWKPPI